MSSATSHSSSEVTPTPTKGSKTAGSSLGKRALDTNPTELTVPIVLSQSYHANNFVSLHSVHSEISIPLDKSGSGVITTKPVVIGTVSPRLNHFKNPNVMASLSVWYKYDHHRKVLTLCSNNFSSTESTYLSTFPEAAPTQVAKQYTHDSAGSPCSRNGCWNYSTSSTPGLQALFHQIVCNANQAVIDAAKQNHLNLITRCPVPQHILNNTPWLVHRNGTLQGFQGPGQIEDLQPDDKLVHVESVFYGETDFNLNEFFANVIGSTNDPPVASMSWLQLWTNQFGVPPCCASYGYAGGQAGGKTAFACGASLVGGHVIVGQVATKVPAGSNDVIIIPICIQHNNNDNVYMSAIKIQQGVALHNYLQ